jgi:hypothetical protein
MAEKREPKAPAAKPTTRKAKPSKKKSRGEEVTLAT